AHGQVAVTALAIVGTFLILTAEAAQFVHDSLRGGGSRLRVVRGDSEWYKTGHWRSILKGHHRKTGRQPWLIRMPWLVSAPAQEWARPPPRHVPRPADLS